MWSLADPAHPALLGELLTGHTNIVPAMAFSPDGKTLATGSKDRTVRLWSLADPAHPTLLGQPLTGHTNDVDAVAFSPDGKTLATGSADRTVRLWSLADPAHPALLGQPLTSPSDVEAVAFSPDGKTLATGGGDRTVWLWDLDPAHAIERICATTSNQLTPIQWDQYISGLPFDPPCSHYQSSNADRHG